MTGEADLAEALILTIRCPDTVGIVAAVSTFLSENNAFITDSAHYGDPDTGRFFMRTVFRSGGDGPIDANLIRQGMESVGDRFHMDWTVRDANRKTKAVVAVSKFGHCLNDLLHRVQTNSIPVEIVAVISNHETFRDLVEWHEIPFHHLPVTPETKPAQEERLLEVYESCGGELLVLARYMQILSPDLCSKLAGQAINIHHSFLPGFKGAKPYHQAHARGVKIIGATAHYVTTDLDEGPIIEQAVERVDHTRTPQDLIHIGQDIENAVLARAVLWHAEQRILLNGTKTVVFR